ncbi:MAG TPA: HRDC domain-containing protein, partial [Thermomicrobiales bacterium]|nr:HRDC domain-containing protein [Thermomicrobiales bacterium]
HCISLWGHDFRPDYLTIPAVLPVLGEPTVLAITATATPEMAVAIGSGLGRDLDRVRASLFRANLHYEAHRCANREDKLAKVVSISRKERGAGIVYVGSRRDADAIAALLRDRGISAVSYHAGLDPETRARAQERFMSGNARVVVATVAFGMGVDKADVRFIIHLSPPRSLEAYAQESGRAGRDGRPARCVLLYSAADKAQLNRLARLDQLSLSVLRDVYRALQQTAVWRWAIVDATKLLPPAGMDEDRPDPRIALGILERAGLIRQHPDAPVFRVVSLAPRDPGEVEETRDSTWQRFRAWVGVDDSGAHERFDTAQACQALDMSPAEINTLLAGQPDLIVRDGPRLTCIELLPSGPDARQRIETVLDRSRQAASRRIDQVMRYAAGRACRHQVLAAHLGERLDPCRTVCDVCLGNRSLLEHDAHSVEASPSTPARSSTTAADALAVLQAVRTLPFSVGKTGLVRLLLGSVESRIRADRSPSFGCLSDVKKARVEALVDRLIEGAFLHRDLDHEYKLISLTPRGASASLDDLAAYGPDALQREDPRSASVDQALLERLTAWRRQRSADDQVPPYVVAHNAMLEEIARARPRSRAELQHIPGFGPKRIDLYGDAILAAVDGDSG